VQCDFPATSADLQLVRKLIENAQLGRSPKHANLRKDSSAISTVGTSPVWRTSCVGCSGLAEVDDRHFVATMSAPDVGQQAAADVARDRFPALARRGVKSGSDSTPMVQYPAAGVLEEQQQLLLAQRRCDETKSIVKPRSLLVDGVSQHRPNSSLLGNQHRAAHGILQ